MNDEITLRRLVIKTFHINKVVFGDNNSIDNGILTINKDFKNTLQQSEDIIEEIKINIIEPRKHDIWVNTIMDIIPISTKALGKIGEGITHTLTGVYVMLTGADVEGNQMAEFGSSEGILKEKLKLNKAGTPSENDYIIHFDVILKKDLTFNRKLPLTIHKVCDEFIQEFRQILKKMDGRQATETHEFYDKIRPNKKKVVIVKQVAGQGAMHDNQLFSNEPSGFSGGKSIIDLGNVPIIMTPNEYRDGALRAMT
ncbi:proline reductase cluster protein PrdD [Thermohalobacter berrensis]|uniref:Proline reductase cluster protein PrdD n=1 Tax=Thermohalobacter berrensis TaxID=99594 RepID=A0A419T8L8_9FIRM|nr:proline reductase cluster protein PrdD [Thermohalobacter berrensis]RKD33802.1 proline reductase cluster protein PrdD [Thermohalobacter berrensis]